MNKQALGRALGYGTRHAAKTLTRAAAAATETSARTTSTASPQPPTSNRPAAAAPPPARGSILRGARSAGRSAWKPLATFTSVVWLQVTGSFYLVFALSLGAAAWKLRHAFIGSPERTHLWIYATLTAVFAYFAISNFVRARLRESPRSAPPRTVR